MSSQEELGQIQINDDVLATIAQYAALEVTGVVNIAGGSAITDFLSASRGPRRGIVVATDDQNSQATIDIDVNVEFGLDIYHVATQLQRAVKNSIEGMTGLKVKSVNVKISGIVMTDKPSKPQSTAISPIQPATTAVVSASGVNAAG